MSALCFLPLMIRAVIPALCFGNILFPLAECSAFAAKNISERRKEKLHLPRHYAPLYLRSASEAVFRGQTAPKAGMTSHSKNKMAPHPVKKQRQGTVFPWCCFFIRSKPGLYKPHPEAPYSSSFIWVYSPSSNPSFFSAAQRTAHSLWKINRLCSRRSCTHRVPSAKRRSEMGQGECLTQ